MQMLSEELLMHLRATYPTGARVKLIHMDDVQAPSIGTIGTVIGVDDMGSIMIHWDNGSSLSAVLNGGDVIKRLGTYHE